MERKAPPPVCILGGVGKLKVPRGVNRRNVAQMVQLIRERSQALDRVAQEERDTRTEARRA